MKKLTGSEKQIAWAEKIRQATINEFNEDLNDDTFDDAEQAKKIFNYIMENADSRDYIDSTQSSLCSLDVYAAIRDRVININNHEISIDKIKVNN
jgi:hypothetical protein